MSIMPAGGWDTPRQGQIVHETPSSAPSVVPQAPTVVLVQTQSKQASAFSSGFGGCLGAICAVVFAAIVLVLIGKVLSMPTATRKPTLQTTNPAEIVSITAPTLEASYVVNEVAAGEKFNGKTIRVGGIIDHITKSTDGTVHIYLAGIPVELGGSPDGVDAMMNSGSDTIAARLSPWQNVILLCDQVQRVYGDLVLRDCEFDLRTASPNAPKYPRPPTSEYSY